MACLVMLSAGGMLYGDVLNFRMDLDVKARRATPSGEVRVEERRLPAANLSVRRLVDHGHVRLSLALDEAVGRPWDVEVWREHMPPLDQPVRVMLIGGGASLAPHAILREHPLSKVEVLERTPAVVELGREHFGTGLAIATNGRLSVRVGNLDDLVASAEPEYDLILVDNDAVALAGGNAGLSSASIELDRSTTNPIPRPSSIVSSMISTRCGPANATIRAPMPMV